MEDLSIVFAGGHAATTAYSVLGEIKSLGLPWEVHFIGAKSAVEGKRVPTLESKLFVGEGVKFHGLIAGRIQRRFTFWTIPSLFKIPVSFVHAFILLRRIKPKVILSFGGFVGFPVIAVGKLLGIPTILHEQTAAAGRANRASSFFAQTVTLARKCSRKYFAPKKTKVIGNPILPFFAKIKPKRSLGAPPTIYITAGSRGSVTINSAVFEILKKLLADFKVIHQAGPLEKSKFKKMKDNLPVALSDNYRVFGQTKPERLKEIYSQADMVISRAGANSVAEIIAARRPAILIPIPWSYLDEQSKNARFAARFGIARILNQGALTGRKLLKEILMLKEDWEKIQSNVKNKKSPDINASKLMVDILESQLGRVK
ncbi:glycosyltransferase [Candidatus Woesebacteria bacterium]|nr:glycosyltransferase [Candidatus Woesebacteria bacterium]